MVVSDVVYEFLDEEPVQRGDGEQRPGNMGD